MASENQIPEHHPSPDASGKTSEQASQTEPEIPPTVTCPQLPPSHANCQITCKQEKNWWDKGKPFVELCGIILLAVYTGYTIKIYRANHEAAIAAHDTLVQIQQQTTLLRDQTIGTQGAILEFDPALSIPAIVTAVRAVPGRVAAKYVEVKLTAQRIYLPSKRPIGNSIQCNINVPQVVGTESPNLILLSGSIRACYLPDFDQAAMDEVMFTRQSVTIRGSFSYDNGFGEISRQDFCRIYLGYKYRGFINGDVNHPTSGEDASFRDCADFDQFLNRALAYKKKYTENYVPGLSP
jgi:hypothetical protein